MEFNLWRHCLPAVPHWENSLPRAFMSSSIKWVNNLNSIQLFPSYLYLSTKPLKSLLSLDTKDKIFEIFNDSYKKIPCKSCGPPAATLIESMAFLALGVGQIQRRF